MEKRWWGGGHSASLLASYLTRLAASRCVYLYVYVCVYVCLILICIHIRVRVIVIVLGLFYVAALTNAHVWLGPIGKLTHRAATPTPNTYHLTTPHSTHTHST